MAGIEITVPGAEWPDYLMPRWGYVTLKELSAYLEDYKDGIADENFPVTFPIALRLNDSYRYSVYSEINGVRNRYYMNDRLSIDTPGDIKGVVFLSDSYQPPTCTVAIKSIVPDLMISINGGASSKAKSNLSDIYCGSIIELWSESGQEIIPAMEGVTFQKNGDRYIGALPLPDDIRYSPGTYTLDVQVPRKDYIITAECGSATDKGIYVNDVYTAGNGASVTAPEIIPMKLRCADKGYRIIEVSDKATGSPLQFDMKKGEVYGVTPGMHLNIKTEKYERNKSFKFQRNVAISNSEVKMILGAGTQWEKQLTLDGNKNTYVTISYNPEDLPIKLDGPYANYPHYVYYCYIGQTEYKGNLASMVFPDQFADDTLVIYNGQNTLAYPIAYKIADDLDVTITENDVPVSNYSKHNLLDGTSIKIKVNPGSTDRILINDNTFKASSDYTEYTGKMPSNKGSSYSVSVDKYIYWTGLDIYIQDSNGQKTKVNMPEYVTVTGEYGEDFTDTYTGYYLRIPARNKYFTVTPIDKDYCIVGGEVNRGSMAVDLTSGRVTYNSYVKYDGASLTLKKIERDKEVEIYVDSPELEGAELVLGNGKTIATGASLGVGNQSIQFAPEDLPIIFKLPESYLDSNGEVPSDPSLLPGVYVNGEKLPYDVEKGGYVFPESAFANPANPPLIRIYPVEPKPVEILFIAEPGINITAIPDGDQSKKITEGKAMEYYSGTNISLTAAPVNAGEEIYMEIDGQEQIKGTSLKYDFMVSGAQSIAFKRRKVGVTVNNTDDWQHIRVNGAGFTYPMYTESSQLEFPVGTNTLTLRSANDEKRITKVVDAKTGSPLNYNATTGVVTGISNGTEMNIEMGPMTRDKSVRVFREDNNDLEWNTMVVAGEDKAIEKEVYLKKGYADVAYCAEDMPLNVQSARPIAVYLDNAKLTSAEGKFMLPESLSETTVVKVYGAEQNPVKVTYDIEGETFKVDVLHDGVRAIDTDAIHNELPGTEISFTVDVKTLPARLAAARRGALKKVNGDTEITVNGEALENDEDGIYRFTITPEHAATGLKFVVKTPVEIVGGITYSGNGKTLISVDPTYVGELIIKDGVTTIKAGAFNGCAGVTKVEVPNSVTTIEDDAFSGCSSLESVLLGSGVQNMTPNAFNGCAPSGKSAYPESLGKNPFPEGSVAVKYSDKGGEVVMEDGYIYNVATVTLPDGSKKQEKTLVFVPADAEVDKNGKFVVPDGVTAIGAGSFTHCDNIKTINTGKDCTTIGDSAFEGCKNITSIEISSSVTAIGDNSFKGTGITALVLPENVKTVGAGAFQDCASLRSVVIPPTIDSMGEEPFKGCKLEKSAYPADKLDKSPFPEGTQAVPYRGDNLEVDPATGYIYSNIERTDSEGNPVLGANGKPIVDRVLTFVPTTAPVDENGNLIIPDGVTSIGAGALGGCNNIKSVTIPPSIASIGEGAFNGCDNLTQIVVGEGVTEITAGAFSGIANLEKITLPKSLEKIGDNAFEGCHTIKEIVIPEGVKEIGAGAFKDCDGLTGINIPNTVTSIGEGAFADCDNITSVVIPDGVTTIGASLFEGCDKLTSVKLPEGITEIPDGMLNGCEKVTEVNVPSTVTRIGENAFNGTAITAVTIPAGVTEIGAGAFKDTDITSVTLPAGVTSIGASAFENTNITSVKIPAGVTEIGDNTFSGCDKLTKVEIPADSKITSIGNNAFAGTEIASIVIPEGVTVIGEGAFEGCEKLTNVNIPDGVETIGANAFNGSSIKAIKLPDSVKELGEGAFAGCNNLETLIIGNGLTSIPDGVFPEGENSKISTIIIPDNVEVTIPESIVEQAKIAKYPAGIELVFEEKIDESTGEPVKTGVIYGFDKESGNASEPTVVVSVPKSVTEFTLPETVTTISAGAFENCENLTTITIPEGSKLETIGDAAFNGCTNLQTVTFPAESQLETIGNAAFNGCTSLQTVTIPEGVTSIGDAAFNGAAITEINIPASVTELGDGAFKGCENLTKVTIPEESRLTTIGDSTFEGTSITSIALPESVASIGNSAFAGTDITSIHIPEGVTVIGDGAFEGCEKLTNVNIPDGVETIGKDAFNGSAVKEVKIPDSVKELGEGAFAGCNNLETVIIGNGLTSIPDGVFPEGENSKISTIIIPENVEVTIPDAVAEKAKIAKYPAGVELVFEEKKDEQTGEMVKTGVIYGFDKETGNPSEPTVLVSVPKSVTEFALPETVTTISTGAFENCENLTTITIPEDSRLETIGDAAFNGCKNLETVTIPEGVTSIGDNAFSGSGIKEIEIPGSVTTIGNGAFSGCENLEEVILPAYGRLESIGEGAFSDTGIREIKIPDTVTELGGGAFADCGNLETVVIGEGVKTIPDDLFSETGNESLRHIFVPEDVEVKLPESVSEQAKVIEFPYGIDLVFEEQKDEQGNVVVDENGFPGRTGVILGVVN
ncbi:MAG: leucine-rich repeat domain-containing protein, partial [Muribaculaceae bacterium]|nr:leucine-rich repeat domain-containing protein [Muribaculaceae bacterium]